MLTKEALEASYGLTEALDANNLKLVGRLNSPLGMLCAKTRTEPSMAQKNDIGDVCFDFDFITSMANAGMLTADGPSAHDLSMDVIAEAGIKAVREHVFVANTIVKPVIVELAEAVLAEVGSMKASKVLGFEVITKMPPKPLENPALVRMTENYTDPIKTNIMPVRIPVTMAGSDLLELATAGTSSLDDDVKAWLAAHPMGMGFISEVWDTVFRRECDPVLGYHDLINSTDKGVERAILVFLLARNLVDKPLEDITMSLMAWTNLMNDLRDLAATAIYQGIQAADKMKKAGIVAIEMIAKTVTVYEPVYREFLEKGGSNELLFAELIGGRRNVTTDALLERAPALLAEWNKYVALDNATSAALQTAAVKNSFYRNFMRQLDEASEDSRAYQGNVEAVKKVFEEMLESLPSHDFHLSHVYKVARKLVCRSRFVATAAETILEGIDEVAHTNPNLDIREAAAIAVINYIADWMFDQMAIEKI